MLVYILQDSGKKNLSEDRVKLGGYMYLTHLNRTGASNTGDVDLIVPEKHN